MVGLEYIERYLDLKKSRDEPEGLVDVLTKIRVELYSMTQEVSHHTCLPWTPGVSSHHNSPILRPARVEADHAS